MSSGQDADAMNSSEAPHAQDTRRESRPSADATHNVNDPKPSQPVQSPQLGPMLGKAHTMPPSVPPNLALSNIFGFIENLAAQLPAHHQSDKPSATSKAHPAPPQVRRTSDLLDTLQKALMRPPTVAPVAAAAAPAPVTQAAHDGPQHFPVIVEIENAVNVTKMCVRINKKSSKQHRSKSEQQFHGVQEQDASTYVTFEAHGSGGSLVNSPDGMVYSTQVVERTSNPSWNQRFDVQLPVEMLLDLHKRFILKVWRKSGTDSPQTRQTPTPFQDTIVGFVTINISLLLEGADSINDWFNVTDLYGRCNGRIKIKVTPTECVERFRDVPKATPAIVDRRLDEALDDLEHDTLLNLTLKRKFTELEDISKRLKARLIDVTDDADFGDLEDEFDTDLNTMPDEDEEDDAPFNWVQAIGKSDEDKSTKTAVIIPKTIHGSVVEENSQ